MTLSKKQKEIIEAEEKYRINIRRKLQTENNYDFNIFIKRIIGHFKIVEKSLISNSWALNINELMFLSKNIWIPIIIIGFLVPFIHTNHFNPLLSGMAIIVSGLILGLKDKFFSFANGFSSYFLGFCLAEFFMEGAGVLPQFFKQFLAYKFVWFCLSVFLCFQYIGSRYHLKNTLNIGLLSLKKNENILLKIIFLLTFGFSFIFVSNWLFSDSLVRASNFVSTSITLLLIWMLFCITSVGILLAKRNKDVKLYQTYVFGFLFCMILLFALGYAFDIQSVKN